jgi:hypothetical protein
MAFDTATTRITAVERAGNTLGQLRTVYTYAQRLRDAKALYLAGTDPVFNAAFEALFTGADRTELATMIDQLTALCITDWEANHPSAIGI